MTLLRRYVDGVMELTSWRQERSWRRLVLIEAAEVRTLRIGNPEDKEPEDFTDEEPADED